MNDMNPDGDDGGLVNEPDSEHWLRILEYQTFILSSHGQIAYCIIGKNIYFTQITQDSTSSVNAAENIIRAIRDKEEIDPSEYTFFDLQTRSGYEYYREGQFELNRLQIAPPGELRVLEWIPVECPEDVLRIFSRYII